MCGLTGFMDLSCGTPDAQLQTIAARMAQTLLHRGPDDGGVWTDEDSGVALAQRRLSIVDLSPEGHQPMLSACGRYVVVFNGEIYNFQALRDELAALGHTFRGHSDTEIMLAAFAEWGVRAALPHFNGMFAFALWDRQERILYLARDRMGEKPLYYGLQKGFFLFGSELKALRAHPAFGGGVDRDALALYLRFGYVPSPHSIYQGVCKLPPASLLEVRAGKGGEFRVEPYWSLRDAAERGAADPLRCTPEEAVEALDARLRETIRLRMVADVPLGAFLSGGVDSSTVVSLMQAQSSRPVKTFTIGFREESYNEAEHALEVARHLGTEHTELYVTPADAMDVVPRLPELYDEPFSDSSQIPTFLVAQLARPHVTVSLSGDGGDELFGGYNRYFLGSRLWGRIGRIPRPLRGAAAMALSAAPEGALDKGLGWLRPLLRQYGRPAGAGAKLHTLAGILGSDSPLDMYGRLVSLWKEPEELVEDAVEPDSVLSDSAQWPELDGFIHQMMYLDAVTYLPDDILVKTDRATMGVSLEGRIPLLDHEVVELAWRLPLEMKVRDGQGKWLLRQVLYRYVPREMIERPKTGFAVPIDLWLRGPLKDWAEALLDESRLRREGYFRPEPVRRAWQQHLSGSRNWDYPLWAVLMFQAWLERQGTAGRLS